MAKFKVPVYIVATASTGIGEVECDSLEEFHEKAQELWESQDYAYPTTYACNKFDLHDWDIDEYSERDLEIYKTEDK